MWRSGLIGKPDHRGCNHPLFDSIGPGHCPGLRDWGHRWLGDQRQRVKLQRKSLRPWNIIQFALLRCGLALDKSPIFIIPSSPFGNGYVISKLPYLLSQKQITCFLSSTESQMKRTFFFSIAWTIISLLSI